MDHVAPEFIEKLNESGLFEKACLESDNKAQNGDQEYKISIWYNLDTDFDNKDMAGNVATAALVGGLTLGVVDLSKTNALENSFTSTGQMRAEVISPSGENRQYVSEWKEQGTSKGNDPECFRRAYASILDQCSIGIINQIAKDAQLEK